MNNRRPHTVFSSLQTTTRLIAFLVLESVIIGLQPIPLSADESSRPDGGFQAAGSSDTAPIAEFTVTPEDGGAFQSEELAVRVPPGAVESNLVISVQRLSATEPLQWEMRNVTSGAAGYRFLPDGQTFLRAIKVTLPFSSALAGSEADLQNLFAYSFDKRTHRWYRLERYSIDRENATITSLTTHFTDIVTSTLALPEGPAMVNFNPTSMKTLGAADPTAGVPRIDAIEAGPFGAASFTLPLRLPTGRGKTTPKLSLCYSSQHQNGWMGRGFDIGISSISIDTRFGLPHYGRTLSDLVEQTPDGVTSRDSYLLDGEELVCRGRDPGILTFIRRREGAFERVRFLTGSERCWEVTEKNGTKRIYGLNEAWIGPRRDDKSSVYSWYLSRIIDTDGNAVDYEYQYDEVNRYTYLSSIRYSSHARRAVEPLYVVRFLVDTAPDARPDRRIDARGRFPSKLAGLLTGIEILYEDSLLIRRYTFEYGQNMFGQTQLVSLAEYDADGRLFYRYRFGYHSLPRNGEGYDGFGSGPEAEQSIMLGSATKSEALQKERTRSLGASLYTGVSLYRLAWKQWKFYWDRWAHFGVRAGFSNSAGRTEASLRDLSGDGVPDLLTARGHRLELTSVDWRNRRVIAERDLGRLPAEVERRDGSTRNIGLSAGLMPLSGAVTWQWGSSKTESTFSDLDGDGLQDFVAEGETEYCRNIGGAFRKDELSIAPDAGKLQFPELSAKQAESLEKSYYLQEPVRKWKSYKGGLVEIENTVAPDGDTRPTAEAITYLGSKSYPVNLASAAVDAPAVQTISSIELDPGEELYFRLDTQGDERGDDLHWRTRIRYNSVRYFDNWEQGAFFREPPAVSRNHLPWTDERFEAIYSRHISGIRPDLSTVYQLEPGWRDLPVPVLKSVYAALYDHGYAIPGRLDEDLFFSLLATASPAMHIRESEGRTYYSPSDRHRIFFGYQYIPEEKTFRRISDRGDAAISRYWEEWLSGLSLVETNRLRQAVYPRFLDGTEILPLLQGSEYSVDRQGPSLSIEAKLYDRHEAGHPLGSMSLSDGYLVDREFSASGETPVVLSFLVPNEDGGDDPWRLVRVGGGDSIPLTAMVREEDDELTIRYGVEGAERTIRLSQRNDLIEELPLDAYEGPVTDVVLQDEEFCAGFIGVIDQADWEPVYESCTTEEQFLLDLFYKETESGGEQILNPVDQLTVDGTIYHFHELLSLIDRKTSSDVDAGTIFNTLQDGRKGIVALTEEEYSRLLDGTVDSAALSALFTACPVPDDRSLFSPRLELNGEETMFLESVCRSYRRDSELFPYYFREEDHYRLADSLDATGEEAVRRVLRAAGLVLFSRYESGIEYRSSTLFPVIDAGLKGCAEIESFAPLCDSDAMVEAGRIRVPLLYGEAGIRYHDIFFRQSDSRRDYSAVQLVDYTALDRVREGGALELNHSLSSGAADSSFEDMDDQEPAREPFRGGANGWFYGAWTGYHEWDVSRLLDTPGYTNTIADVTDAADPALRGQEIPDPPYFLPMCPNNPDDLLESTGRAGSIGVAADAWLGKLSEYSDVEWNDDGSMEFTEHRFAAFIDCEKMHPERYGGDTYHKVPRSVSAAGSDSLSSIRKSKNDAFDINGGIVMLGGSVSHNNGTSWQYKEFRDINGDRYPDVLLLPTNGGTDGSVLWGGIDENGDFTLSEPAAVNTAYPYLVRSKNDGYGVGASPASTGGSLTSDCKDGKWETLAVSIADASPGLNLGFNASAGATVTGIDLKDINGDGLPDQLHRTDGGDLMVALNTGGDFPATARQSFPSAMNAILVPGIFGNDARSSGLAYANVGSFGETVGASTGGTIAVGATGSLSGSVNRSLYDLIDFNGDGLPDQVIKRPGHSCFEVRFNLGDRFAAETTRIYKPGWSTIDLASAMLSALEQNVGDVIESFTGLEVPGDCLDFVPHGLGDWDAGNDHFGAGLNPLTVDDVLSYSSGLSLSFGANITFKIPFWEVLVLELVPGVQGTTVTTTSSLLTQDISGDGLPDHILRVPGEEKIRVMENRLGPVGLLESVYSPFGGETNIEYIRVGNTENMPMSRWVPNKIVARDGLENSTERSGYHSYTSTVNYSNGLYDRAERVFCGFGSMQTTRYSEYYGDGIAENRIASVREDRYLIDPAFENNYWRRGLLSYSRVLDRSPFAADARIYYEKNFDYQFDFQGVPGSYFPRLVEKRERLFDPATGEHCEKAIRYSAYDDFGNVVVVDDLGAINDPADDMKAILEYADLSFESYLHQHPSRIDVTDDRGTLVRRRMGEYHPVTGHLRNLSRYSSTDNFVTHFFEYDDFGNLNRIEEPGGRTLTIDYTDESDYMYPTEISVGAPAEATYHSSMSWDLRFGKEVRLIDQNGNRQIRNYDTFGRLCEVFSPYDTGPMPAIAHGYLTPDNTADLTAVIPWQATTVNKVSHDPGSADDIVTVVSSDGLGRSLQLAKEGVLYHDGSVLPGWNCSGAVVYDAAGRVSRQGQTVFAKGIEGRGLTTTPPELVALIRPTIRSYDPLNRVVATTLPGGYDPVADENTVEARFETLYRIENECLVEQTVDPLGNSAESVKDMRGNIVEVRRRDDEHKLLKQVSYLYSPLGELNHSLEHDLESGLRYPVDYRHDLLGHRTSITSPDAGQIIFEYDDAGNLTRTVDSNLRALGEEIRYTYDGHNRLTRVTYPHTEATRFIYGDAGAQNNCAGRLVRREDASGSIEYRYGKLGEVLQTERTLEGLIPSAMAKSATTQFVYDYLGRLEELTYPDRETVFYTFDAGGQVTKISGTSKGHTTDYVQTIGYDQHGQRVHIAYGNGVTTDYAYDPYRRWLTSVVTTDPYGVKAYQNIQYQFDTVGNILGYTNQTPDYCTEQNYTYDDLYQIETAVGSYAHTPLGIDKYVSTYSQSYQFDSLGNFTNKQSDQRYNSSRLPKSELNYDLDYKYYDGTPHRVEWIGNVYFSYDVNGNVIEERVGGPSEEAEAGISILTKEGNLRIVNRAFALVRNPRNDDQDDTYTRCYNWDEENRLTSFTDGTTSVRYAYDAEGNRTIKSADNSETLYFDQFFQVVSIPGEFRQSKHIYLGETRIATRLNLEGATDFGYEKYNTYYYHPDHLGSAQLVTRTPNTQLGEHPPYEHLEYTPFGELWEEQTDSEDLIPFRFTGKEWDKETKLYYFGARYYDPKRGRWLSSDPLGSELNDPGRDNYFMTEALNWYSYVSNNPLMYVDPTGMIILSVRSLQHQNSEANAGAYPGGFETGYYDRAGAYRTNTIGRFGCLFTAAVNIGNTVRRNQFGSRGIPEYVVPDQSVSSLAQSTVYFAFKLSKINIGTEFASGPSHIKQLLLDMTGKSYSVVRLWNNKESQHAISKFGRSADSAFEKAFIIAAVTTERGNLHFINVNSVRDDGSLYYHDPYQLQGGTKTGGYNLDDVIGAYIIEEE